MDMSVRRFAGVGAPALGIAVLAAVLLAGCGSQETGARTTLAPIQPSSYVVREPATTTTTIEIVETGVEAGEGGRAEVEQEYTVRPNDSVAGISSRFGVEAADLAAYNDWPNGIRHTIFPGDVIRVPPGALVPQEETPTTTTDPRVSPDGECQPTTYTVVAGDFPGRIAGRFDITVEQLATANSDTPGYSSLLIGTELIIPCP
jgi:LysM repeat protein